MKTILIQSRLSSSRFPKKMLEKINGLPLVEYVYRRCKESKQADAVVVITSEESSDDELAAYCHQKGIPMMRGSLDNVLARYVMAASALDATFVCRVCGDSPFVDYDLIDRQFKMAEEENLDYTAVINLLNGFVSEVIEINALKKIQDQTLTAEDMEHVTRYIRNNLDKFKYKFVDADLRPEELTKYTLTVDFPNELIVANKIAKKLNGFGFNSNDVIKILREIDNEI